MVLKKHIKICPSGESIIIRATKKERLLHPIDMSYFSRLESKVCQRILRTPADGVFQIDDSADLPRLFSGFVRIFF